MFTSGPSSLYLALRTNTRLTNEDEATVRRAMSGTQSKLLAVEIETARLRARLVYLHQSKNETQEFIKIHQGLLSPIRRLLPEMLQEIFWRCLPTAHNSVLRFQEAPLVLGRVCRQWRRIAYSTPNLWSSLHISAAPLTYPRAKARLDAADAWLARSGILPLSISLYCFEWGSVCTGQFQPYFDLISKYGRRWKYIHLVVEPTDPLNFLMELTADDHPVLEELHIQRNPFDSERAPLHFLRKRNCVLSTPSLRTLSINDASVRILDLPVDFKQLTGLSLAGLRFDLHNIMKVLTLCPNLETFVLTVGQRSSLSTSTSDSPIRRPEIVLPKLQTLKIFGRLIQDLLNLLDNLSTPALRHFAYQRSDWPPWPGSPVTSTISLLKTFRSFFQRLREPLEELEIHVTGFTTSNMVAVLSLFPDLKKLSLRHSDTSYSVLNDGLFRAFVPYEHRIHCRLCSLGEDDGEEYRLIPPCLPGCLCPELEVLHIDSAAFSKHILFECLHSRLVNHKKYDLSRLRRFSITFDLEWEDDDVTEAEVEKVAEESGLVVDFESLPAPTHSERWGNSGGWGHSPSYSYSPYEGAQTESGFDFGIIRW